MRHYGSKDPEGVLISSTNFSPDCRVHTEVYDIKTTSPACWPCICVKGGYPEASARKLLDVLAEAKRDLWRETSCFQGRDCSRVQPPQISLAHCGVEERPFSALFA